MGIEHDNNMGTDNMEPYGGADGPAATPAASSAMEQDTAAILPPKESRTWEKTLSLLQSTHTICIREICQQLKSSRSWVSKYIMPYLDKVYLDTGYRGDRRTKKSWTQLVAIRLGDEKYLTNSVWCNEMKFEKLIRMHAVSVIKQTRCIPFEFLVTNKRAFAEAYKKNEREIARKKEEILSDGTKKKLNELMELQKNRETIKDAFLSKVGKIILSQGLPDITKRSRTVPVKVELPETPIREWRALHDEKEYGDTDEHILRKFFKEGCIRVEIHIPDPKALAYPATIFDSNKTAANTATISATTHVNSADVVENGIHNDNDNGEHIAANMDTIYGNDNGCHSMVPISESINGADMGAKKGPKCSKKIYYIDDPERIKHQYVEEYVTIEETIWQQWKHELL